MSEAIVLTEKQKQCALKNFKKGKKRKVPPRNVYADPRSEYWPVAAEEDESMIVDLIKRLLPTARSIKKAKPEGSQRGVKRKAADASDAPKKEPPILEEKGKVSAELLVGLRKVTVAMEQRTLKCLLLARDVDPPSLGYLVGNLAVACNIPFLTVSNLREVVEEVLGFKSWCLGFLTSPESHFYPIYEKVKCLTDELQETRSFSGLPATPKDTDANRVGSTFKPKPVCLSSLHLRRSDKSQRIFVPESTASRSEAGAESFLSFSKEETNSGDFISATSSRPEQSIKNTKKLKSDSLATGQPQRYFQKVPLLPLTVKKFQGNPNKQNWRKETREILKKSLKPG